MSGLVRVSVPAVLLAGLLVIFAVGLAPVALANGQKWHAYIESGGSISTNDYKHLEQLLFVPLMQSYDNLLFLDARGKAFNNDDLEGNFTVGNRHIFPSGIAFGLHGSFDLRRMEESGEKYRQAGIGGEIMTDTGWETRINLYHALDDAQVVTRTAGSESIAPGQVNTDGGKMQITYTKTITTAGTVKEIPLSGVDIELGKQFEILAGPRATGEFGFYLGGYYFDDYRSEEDVEAVSGIRARSSVGVYDFVGIPGAKLAASVVYEYDDVRDHRGSVGLRFRVPLQRTYPEKSRYRTHLERRMNEPVVRDIDIVTDKLDNRVVSTVSATENVINTTTGVEITGNVAKTADNGDDLATAVAAADENGLIIATGNVDGNAEMKAGQTLIGGGSSLSLRGTTTGHTYTWTAGGNRPTISYTGNDDVISVANYAEKVHIKGVEVTGNTANLDNDGIDLDLDDNGSYIEDNIIKNVGGTGIEISRSDNVTVINNQVENSRHGIVVSDNANMRISHNTVKNTTTQGIAIANMNNATISNNTITSGAGATDKTNSAFMVYGYEGSTGITFKDNTIEGDFDDHLIDIDVDTEFTNSTGNDKGGVVTVGGNLCDVDGGAIVTGQISFTDLTTCP
jgi:parallel beta-helix repeat protein